MSVRKKKYVIIITVLTVIIVIAGVFVIRYLSDVKDYQNKVESLTYSQIDISTIPDGVYTGECNVGFISAKVEVSVSKGRLEHIKLLEHKNERGEPAEVITEEMLKEQKIDVDAVSGATNSSKVIKKAVENALLNK